LLGGQNASYLSGVGVLVLPDFGYPTYAHIDQICRVTILQERRFDIVYSTLKLGGGASGAKSSWDPTFVHTVGPGGNKFGSSKHTLRDAACS